MSATQHAPAPIPLPRDDKPPSLTASSPPPRSPTYSRPSDPKPIAQHQPRDSPSPPSKPATVPTPPSSRPSSPNPPQEASESTSQETDEDESDDNIIDMDTFMQLVEFDEDEPDFSKGMVWEYFSQAKSTFEELDDAFSKKDLPTLSSKGHFFKGSSAALGLARVQLSCEKIQHYGLLRDEEADRNLTEEDALSLIEKTLARVKKEYAIAEKWLRDYYKDSGDES